MKIPSIPSYLLCCCTPPQAEMVIFEAARAICNLRDVTSRELAPAITVLQLFLSSSKPVLRFAAVRTLNKVCGGSDCLHLMRYVRRTHAAR